MPRPSPATPEHAETPRPSAAPGRDAFASTLGAFAATVGSAVGLGNIWKFPYLTGSNGGAAFVLTYLLAVALVGLPVMTVEHVIGRRMRLDAVRAYARVVPGQRFWSAIGWAGLVAAVLIMSFYTDVAGWVFAYVFKSLGAFVTGEALTPETFGALAGGTWEPILWQARGAGRSRGIIAAGVSKGIEKVTKTLMPLLFVLLIVCDIRALTLPGAFEGVGYLFAPDLSKLTRHGPPVGARPRVLQALARHGHDDDLRVLPARRDADRAERHARRARGHARLAPRRPRDLPAVFAFGGTPAGGPGLLFNTIPLVFSKMPIGGLFTDVFFVLAAIATIGAMVSLIEVPVAWFVEKGHVRRPGRRGVTGGIMFALGVLATLSQSPVLGGREALRQDVLRPVRLRVVERAPAGGRPRDRDRRRVARVAEGLPRGGREGPRGAPWHDRAIHLFVRYVAPGAHPAHPAEQPRHHPARVASAVRSTRPQQVVEPPDELAARGAPRPPPRRPPRA